MENSGAIRLDGLLGVSMIKDRMLKLFAGCEPAVQKVIEEVLSIEQEYISMKSPRGVKEAIKEVIDRTVKK
jgi:hypothetical protein